MPVQTFDVPDPGEGRRLSESMRAELEARVRDWKRTAPDPVLITVAEDAWAHRAAADPSLEGIDAIHRCHSLVASFFRLPGPVVVWVEGEVSGLGLALVLSADICVAGERASASSDGSALSALLGGGSWLAHHAGAAAEFRRLVWTGGPCDRSAALAGGLFTAAGSRLEATEHAMRLESASGAWSALKRGERSRGGPELERDLRYSGWLSDLARESSG